MGDTPSKLVYHIKIAIASSIELAGKRASESRSCTDFAYLSVFVFALACMHHDVSLCLLGFGLVLFRYMLRLKKLETTTKKKYAQNSIDLCDEPKIQWIIMYAN